MKKIISTVILVLMLCGTAINVSAVKVDIPFDYCASPKIRVYDKAENGAVSVEVCQGGLIIVTDLSSGAKQKLKHICYEEIYWVEYIDDRFIAFSSNYMMTSEDGYEWDVYYDNIKMNNSFHEVYGVDSGRSDSVLYLVDNIPEFEVVDSSYQREDGLNVYVKIVYTGREWFKFEDTVFDSVADNYDDNGVMRSAGDFDRAIYKSSDRQTWEYIETRESNAGKFETGEASEIIPFPGFRHDSNIQIINTGKEYLVRSTTYDTIDNRYGYSQPVIVYDYNLNRVKNIRDNGNIVDMSYVDGVYYYTNDESQIYRSTDLDNWEIVGENLGCPMKNSLTTIYKTRYNLVQNPEKSSAFYSGIITTKNGVISKDVVTEGIMLFGTRQFGDFYVAFDRKINNDIYDISQVKGVDGTSLDIYRNNPDYSQESIFFSKDGIYWAAQEIPSPWHILRVDMTSEGIVIECSYDNLTTRLISIKFSDMEQAVPMCDTKVELNNRVLGFSQPPIMEDDRTLVPMRFLFEQMGAEVTWDEATQSATATINTSALGAEGASATGRATLSNSDISFPNLAKTEKSVTFSVDNTTATVNGAPAIMDVPARLINDQTFVPLRFLSENLGYTVDWDETTNTAIVLTK